MKWIKEGFVIVKSAPQYIISREGVVIRPETGRVLSQSINSCGYRVVALRKDGRGWKTSIGRVHRLLAETFIPNPENKKEVNHKDGNKLNNSLGNLEWVSHRENTQHAYDTGLLVMPSAAANHLVQLNTGRTGSKNPAAKKVICLTTGKIYDSIKEAAKDKGYCLPYVSNVLNGSAPNHINIKFYTPPIP